MQTNKNLLDKNHPNTILNMYGNKVSFQELFASMVNNNVEDSTKSKIKQPISPNTIQKVDATLTQQYLEDIDCSK